MRQPTIEHLAAMLADHEPPCISFFQPTHRNHPDNQGDPIRFRNLVRDLEDSLRQKYPSREVAPVLEPFRALARDTHFWNHRTDGLAILAAPGTFQLFELQRPVPERVVVADTFHTKPLLRILQSADRYQILCLTRQTARLYEGNRDALDPVDLVKVPATITEALGEELTEPYLTVGTYGKGPAGRGEGVYHGHGTRKDEVDADTERFFRVVDRAILEHHSRPSGLPLMLAALAEYHAPFRAVSRNPFLMEDGLRVNPDALSPDQLRAAAWELVGPRYLERLATLTDAYQADRSRQLGSDDLADIARAAVAGRFGALLVDADRVVPGRIDPATGEITPGDLAHPDVDDLLDDLAQTVLRKKGTVVVVPADRMPAATGAAATYRF